MSFAIYNPINELSNQINSMRSQVYEIDNDPTGVIPIELYYPSNQTNVIFKFKNKYTLTDSNLPITIGVNTDTAKFGNKLIIQWSMDPDSTKNVEAYYSGGLMFLVCGTPDQPTLIDAQAGFFSQEFNYNGTLYITGDTC